MPPNSTRLKQWTQGGAKAQSIESADKTRDMLPKQIHKDFRKTASAECSFFYGRSKFSIPGRALGFLSSPSGKCQRTFPGGKVTVTLLQNVGVEVKMQTE